MRNIINSCLVLFMLFSVQVQSDSSVSAKNFQAGKHYVLLKKTTPSDGKKVEVKEFMLYGCKACRAMELFLTGWRKDLPEYVDFSQNHALWEGFRIVEVNAQTFYAAKKLGIFDTTKPQIFSQIHDHKNSLATNEKLVQFFADFNVDKKTFDAAFNSPEVADNLAATTAQTKRFNIDKVPSFIINGKYRVEMNKYITSPEQVLDVVNFLINKEAVGMGFN